MEDGSSEGSSDQIAGAESLLISAAFIFVTVVFCCWCYNRMEEPLPARDHTRTNTDAADDLAATLPNNSEDTAEVHPQHTQATDVVVDLPVAKRGTRGLEADRASEQGSAGTSADANAHSQKQPHYAAWVRCYNATRNGMFGDAVSFVEENHACANNRKTQSGGAGPECGGSGWTLLHQAAYWQIPRGMLERLAASGADGLLSDWQGRTPLEITADGEREGLESRLDWQCMYREVFQIPPLGFAAASADDVDDVDVDVADDVNVDVAVVPEPKLGP